MRDVIAEIIQIINWTLQNKELQIEFRDLSGDDANLEFDKRRLQQVVLNILTNAVKFQRKGVIKVVLKVGFPSSNQLLGQQETCSIQVKIID